MPGRWKILVAMIGAALGALLAWHFLSAKDVFHSTFQGRTLKEWNDQWWEVRHADNTTPAEDAEALAAIRGLCSNHLPALVAAMDYDPRPRERRMESALSWLPRWLSLRLYDGPLADRAEARSQVAEMALNALGPEAAPVLPQLQKLALTTNDYILRKAALTMVSTGTNGSPWVLAAMADQNSPRQFAALEAFVLTCFRLRTNADATAMPVLLRCLQSGNPRAIKLAAGGLGRAKMEPATTVPALVRLLSQPDPGTRLDVIYGLREFGELARPAVPDLLRACQDPSVGIRRAASNALEQIAPEVLTNAPAH